MSINTQLSFIRAIKESIRTGNYSPSYKNIFISWLLANTKINVRNSLESLKRLNHIIFSLFSRSRISSSEFFYLPHKNHSRYKNFNLFEKQLYEIFHISILPTLLRNYDKYSMANGVEIRMPFMDYKLVQYTFSIPWQSKVGNSYSKRILRDSMNLRDFLLLTQRPKISL